MFFSNIILSQKDENVDVLEEALNELDNILIQQNKRIRIVICGAFAIQLHGLSRLQRTEDVDSILRIEAQFLEIISNIGKKYGLSARWLNDQAATVSFPEGTIERSKPTGHWKNIDANLIERLDLIKMKASAFSIRRDVTQKDWDDLLLLKPTKDEISEAITFIKSSNVPPVGATHNMIADFEETINDLRSITK